MATKQAIDDLKANWMKDPCWDIEETEGFEEHKEELQAFRLEQEKEWKRQALIASEKKAELLGWMSPEIIDALHTFAEIEIDAQSVDSIMGDFNNYFQMGIVEILQAQTRATLLQASQTKRLADQVERIADRLDEIHQ